MPGQQITSTLRRRLIAQDKQVKAELAQVAETYADLLKSKHEKVVRDWTHRPAFESSTYVSRRQILANVRAKGKWRKLYGWIDQGTKAHIIQPKVATYLHFQTGYDARTAPRGKFNQGSGRRSGQWVKTKVVYHTGTKARDFSGTFNDEVLPLMRRDIENAIRRGLRRA